MWQMGSKSSDRNIGQLPVGARNSVVGAELQVRQGSHVGTDALAVTVVGFRNPTSCCGLVALMNETAETVHSSRTVRTQRSANALRSAP